MWNHKVNLIGFLLNKHWFVIIDDENMLIYCGIWNTRCGKYSNKKRNKCVKLSKMRSMEKRKSTIYFRSPHIIHHAYTHHKKKYNKSWIRLFVVEKKVSFRWRKIHSHTGNNYEKHERREKKYANGTFIGMMSKALQWFRFFVSLYSKIIIEIPARVRHGIWFGLKSNYFDTSQIEHIWWSTLEWADPFCHRKSQCNRAATCLHPKW